MRKWLRPTLARRVIAALLFAFALIWVLLIVVRYIDITSLDRHDRELRGFGDDLVETLQTFDQQREAIAVMAATEAQIARMNARNHVPVATWLQLRSKTGELLYASEASKSTPMQGALGKNSDASSPQGQWLRVYRGETPHWVVLVGRSPFPKQWVVEMLASDVALYMSIAFPFALVPIWLAVSQGLRPLREMSKNIDGRSVDDLSPTGLHPRHQELVPLARSLDNLLGQLRTKVKRESAFVHEAAHELRTPMAVVSAQAHALVHASQPEERQKAEHQLDHAIARASHLVEQLLQIAKTDSEVATPPKAFDMAQELRQALAMLAPSSMAKDLDLSLDAPDVVQACLDLNAFRCIVHNLVGNAILYVPAGGKIAVTLSADDAAVQLSVADDGPGIAPQFRDLVFERFYRGSGHDEPGAGLGLAIVKQATAKLCGRVWIEDGIDAKGCRFIVTIARFKSDTGRLPGGAAQPAAA